jgi:hypothetical protein
MASNDSLAAISTREVAFESFGVRIGVGANDPRVWQRIAELIPPDASACDAETVEHHFSVISEDGRAFTVRYDVRDGVPARIMDSASYVATDVDSGLALGLLDTHLHATVAFRAVDRVFIHGGAVAYRGRGIIVPGPALSGKSTLVAALLRAGATYYSDQFVVLDEEGRVHPYAAPLRLSGAELGPADQNGDQAAAGGLEPLPVATIVMTSYLPGAEWNPMQLSKGEAVLALMSHTVVAQEKPEESMHAIRRMLDGDPLVAQGDRDEADPVAGVLLAELERRFSGSA